MAEGDKLTTGEIGRRNKGILSRLKYEMMGEHILNSDGWGVGISDEHGRIIIDYHFASTEDIEMRLAFSDDLAPTNAIYEERGKEMAKEHLKKEIDYRQDLKDRL